ncbi:hypothetical protein D3C85_91190 [compost metagenome]
MNVRDAISLMAKNPAVGFTWEPTLITLVNGFLPSDRQLDPSTAEAKEIQDALATLDVATQDMILTSSLGVAAGGQNPTPAPLQAPAQAPAVPWSPSELQKLVGLSILFVTVLVAAKNGLNIPEIIELIKVLSSM